MRAAHHEDMTQILKPRPSRDALALLGPDSDLHAASDLYALARQMASNARACRAEDPQAFAMAISSSQTWTWRTDGSLGQVMYETITPAASALAWSQYRERFCWSEFSGAAYVHLEAACAAEETTRAELEAIAAALAPRTRAERSRAKTRLVQIGAARARVSADVDAYLVASEQARAAQQAVEEAGESGARPSPVVRRMVVAQQRSRAAGLRLAGSVSTLFYLYPDPTAGGAAVERLLPEGMCLEDIEELVD